MQTSRTLRPFLFIALAAAIVTACLRFIPPSFSTTIPPAQSVQQVQTFSPAGLATTTVTIRGHIITAEIADTEATMEKGLGDRSSLSPDTGMWFVFGTSGPWGIWMKDMHFTIDVLWLDQSMKIVSIVEHMTPGSYPQVYLPTSNASYVLELPDGTVEKYRFSVGDAAKIGK